MPRDILSAKDFERPWIEGLFSNAEALRKEIEAQGRLGLAQGRLLITVFLEPSTRTRLSFQFAMMKLGGEAIDFGLESTSSLAKGESFEDTIRMVDGYGPDLIVLRSPEVGSAQRAAELARAPVINAGDGWNEHPTQALLDAYTLWRELGKIDGLRLGIMGDLRYGRTPSSLAYCLSNFRDVRLHFIAPPQLRMREEVLKELKGRGANWEEHERLEEVGEELDALYVTRLQRERLPPEEYERLKGSYVLSPDLLRRLRRIPLILHPLPRREELPTSIDALPQARYFQQAVNGLYLRAALIKEVLGL